MQNLKIRVNSEAESKEAQELFFKLGLRFVDVGDFDYPQWLAVIRPDGKFSNYSISKNIWHTCNPKEITLPELRAMVNPMKEYLVPQNAGGFMYKKAYESKCIPDSWIEIPEGAQVAIFDYERLSFAKPINGGDDVLVWDVGFDIKWDTTEWSSWAEFIDYGFKVVWQRATHPEELPFIDDEPKYTDDEVKYMDENGKGRLQSINDQYAEIEQVWQVEIHGTVKAAPDLNFGAAQASGGVDATLSERQSRYGCYEDVAHVTQQILSVLRIGNYDELPAPMKESLHMIASKMARIVNGDAEYLDNWHDIGGYAKLIEKLIKGE